MGWAYSVDLRERVIAAFDLGGMSDEDAAELFQIGEATVHRWKRLKKESLKATEQLDPRIQELRRKFLEFAKTLDPMTSSSSTRRAATSE